MEDSIVKNRISEVRLARGIKTQAQLAKTLDVPQVYVHRWENGKGLTVDWLLRLSAALEATPSELLGYSDDKCRPVATAVYQAAKELTERQLGSAPVPASEAIETFRQMYDIAADEARKGEIDKLAVFMRWTKAHCG